MVVTTSGDSNGGVGVRGDGSICPEKENMVVQYIATRVMLYLCEETVWGPREWVHRIWWEQDLLDLAGSREDAEEAADRGGVSEREEYQH